MKIKKIEGVSADVYKYISPYAMDLEFVKKNGNPITTSKLHRWYLCFDKENLLGFCSVKFSLRVKSMQMGNFFVFSRHKTVSKKIIRTIIRDFAKEKMIALRTYSNNENLELFLSLGFEIVREGVNWHQLKYIK